MQIEHISTRLVRDDDGIYKSPEAKAVSYATDGHAQCFQVEDHSFWFRHRNDCIAAVVARHSFTGAMLDIGGGNGYVAQRLADEGHTLVLIEPGPVGARNARLERGLEHVICSTIEDAEFEPGSFGALGMFDVIEHIEDDRSFLAGASRLLAPGGMLYLTVPCHDWLWSHADIGAGHYRRHSAASLERLLDGIFDIEFLTYMFRPLVFPQFLLRALPYKLGIGARRRLLSSETEHGTGNSAATRLLGKLLENEARKIACGQRIGFGASCLLAARRR